MNEFYQALTYREQLPFLSLIKDFCDISAYDSKKSPYWIFYFPSVTES